jgi:hypothetical protein
LGALAPGPVYAEDGAGALENTFGVSLFRTDSAAGCPNKKIMIVVSVESMARWSDPPEKMMQR